MRTINTREMEHCLAEVLSRAHLEPVTVTTQGKPSHGVLSYGDYLVLTRASEVEPFHRIADPGERSRAVDGWIDSVLEGAAPANPGEFSREDVY